MARFNKKTDGENKTVNYEGATAYKLSAELELYSLVCTSALQEKFYTSNESEMTRLRKLIGQVDPCFAAALAMYARESMYLRSIPLVLLVELAALGGLTSQAVARVISRADEITELLALYQARNGRTGTKKLNKLSVAISHGIKEVFESGKFDEYQFAKYNRKTDVTFKDAIFLTHPRAKDDAQDKLFKSIINGALKTPYTWETELSEKGNNVETWEALIASKKCGYMAMLRNLRNILNARTKEPEGGELSGNHAKMVTDFIGNKEAVERSKQLPFRFFSAYKEIENVSSAFTPEVLAALEQAAVYTASNIKGYDENTSVLIACDVSASMLSHISPKSKVQNYDIGLVLGMLLQSRCERVVTGLFGDIFKPMQFPKAQILSNVLRMHSREGEVGYSTNGYKVLEWAIRNGKAFDKIMMFTDCQMWNSYGGRGRFHGRMNANWQQYKSQIAPNAKLYLYDLADYGNTPLSVMGDDVYLIAGWSDKIFNVLDGLDSGEKTLSFLHGAAEALKHTTK